MRRRIFGWPVVAVAVTVAVAAGVWHATASAATSPDLLVHLTSGPITAHSGQRVTHTVEIAAAGEAAGDSRGQMTFTTTIPLDGATVTATEGHCQVVSPVSVTCDVEGTFTRQEPVVVTISGQIPAATAAGQVVYNVAQLVTAGPDPDTGNNTSSNAYVLAATALIETEVSDPAPVAAAPVSKVGRESTTAPPSRAGAVLAAIALAGLAQAAVMYLLRRRRSGAVTAPRHRRPAGYRPRHATSFWRRFAQTEIRRWGKGSRRHRAARTYRSPVSLPASGLVLLLILSLITLPGPAASASAKPSPAPSSVQDDRPSSDRKDSRKEGDGSKKKDKKDKKRDKKKDDKEPEEPKPVAPAEPASPPVESPPQAPAPQAPAPQAPAPEAPPPPDTEPMPAPQRIELPLPEAELPKVEGDPKTIEALHRSLRRSEYLHQVVTRTKADLASARMRAAQLEERRAAPEAVEAMRSTAAVLQMAAESTEAELKRVEARTAELSKQALDPVRGQLAKVVQGRVTSKFGNRFDPYYKRWQLHAGVDIAAATGTPVRAATAGVVRQAGWNGGYGKHTCIEHGDLRGERLSTCYSHQSEIGVSVGQQVRAGDIIGKVGSTGASTGPHLHFEVKLADRPIDPMPWIQGA